MEIKYSTARKRWEVYGNKPQIRGGEPQPSFVSASYEECEKYRERVENRG